MKLYEILQHTLYFQRFAIYSRNTYDQHILLGVGRAADLRQGGGESEDGCEDDLFFHLGDDVDQLHIGPDNTIYVFVKDEHYEEKTEARYDPKYVARWDRYKPETRPYRWASELPCFGWLKRKEEKDAEKL